MANAMNPNDPTSTFSSDQSSASTVPGLDRINHPGDDTCWICCSALGKRRLNPRHHCRICKRPVCGACSPCKVMIDDVLERSCTACASNALKANAITQQLSFLARQLADLSGRSPDDIEPPTLEAALTCCEEAVEPLRKERVKHKIVERRRREVEEELNAVQKKLDRLKRGECRMRQEKVEVPGRILSDDSLEPGPIAGRCPNVSESHCWICSCRLGKRFLNPRHHCRVCLRPVCGQCSPSCITMEGRSTTQRACRHCMNNAARAPEQTRRLEVIARGLNEMAFGKSTGGLSQASPPSLEEALRQCEVGFQMLMEAQR